MQSFTNKAFVEIYLQNCTIQWLVSFPHITLTVIAIFCHFLRKHTIWLRNSHTNTLSDQNSTIILQMSNYEQQGVVNSMITLLK